jgi:predicted nucleic acid-binding protein
MTAYFFDTSALVKRFHDEKGTEQVDEIITDEDNEVIVSSLLIVETLSAFRRKHNRSEISKSEMTELVSTFFKEALEKYVIVPMEESLLTFSFDLVLENDLRTLDSLQLSAGLSLDEDLDGMVFVTADGDLAAVASNRGLDTVVPS